MAENGLRVFNSAAGASAGEDNSNGSVDYSNDHADEQTNDNSTHKPRLNETAQKYIQELLAERVRLENHFPLATKLIDEALERVQLNGRLPAREQYADVYQQRAIKLTQKVHVPIKDKKFNYVGKLLGPKGNSLRRLQEETQCKIVILGRFSMKDRVREEELRNSAEVKYSHLNLPLHVEVSTIAPPAEAYARVAYALAELRPYLIPDKHDDIRQQQFRELMEDPEAAKKITVRQQHQQQQQQQQQQSNQHHARNNNGNNASGSSYRSKYSQHQQSSNFHHNNENVHYRGAPSNYHQSKPYMASQRSMMMGPSQGLVSGGGGTATAPAGVMTPFSGRTMNGIGGNLVVVGNNTGGNNGGPGGNVRYRQLPSYQYVKK